MSAEPDAVRLRRLREAIADLPRPLAEVFAPHVGGLDYPAISVRLGIDLAEVERRLAQALVSLDRAMEDDGTG